MCLHIYTHTINIYSARAHTYIYTYIYMAIINSDCNPVLVKTSGNPRCYPILLNLHVV